MNWDLLLILAGTYTMAFFLLGNLQRLGLRVIQKRFEAEFGLPISEENIALLDPDQSARWESIYRDCRAPYRWLEVLHLFFLWPSILVLGGMLKQTSLSVAPMYFISGVAYVSIFYWLLR